MFTENNNYCEVLISPPPVKNVKLMGTLYVVVAVICAVVGLLINPLYLILTVVCGFLGRKVLGQANTEYEYQFWGRQLDVEAVQGGETRKPIGTFMMDNVQLMAQEDSPLVADFRRIHGDKAKKLDLTDRDPYGAPVYVMFIQEEELFEVRLQPSREMLRKMWQVAYRTVHIPQELKRGDGMDF
ncbi:MAG: hypothetical protein IJD21_07805 [Oscillospiraceae bacterium]|nr:hypothetical protein [Oscillospiraceae bacterium]